MTRTITGKTLLKSLAAKTDRILLVNPPVFDTRYSWLRWNQPLDLLNLAAYLKSHVRCGVELLDFMLPDSQGKVPKRALSDSRKHRIVGDCTYPMWCFGRPIKDFDVWLANQRVHGKRREPTQVWITSLCSYWFESVHLLCNHIRHRLPDAQIVLIGNYPRFMPEHAKDFSGADVIVTKQSEFDSEGASIGLYGETIPPFGAIPLNPASAISTIKNAVEKGVTHFAFFDEDICRDDGGPLAEIVTATRSMHPHMKFHAICGLHPDRITPKLAKLFADKTFAELHFEESEVDRQLHREAYEGARRYITEAGVDVTTGDKTSGFVWIGRPGDNLEELVSRSFYVLEKLGSLILKPFTPEPQSIVYREHQDYLDAIPYDEWSPHLFPFAELNDISRDEYHDLYRVAAFLNEKVRNRSFDFLNGHLGTSFLRESLRREAWNIKASPLSLVD